MNCSLTEYRRPMPRYGRAALSRSPWRALGGWRQTGAGEWRRVYGRAGRRARTARRAVVCKQGGWWRWHVEQFDLGTRATRRICARGVNGYLFAQYAWGFADLAALTAD